MFQGPRSQWWYPTNGISNLTQDPRHLPFLHVKTQGEDAISERGGRSSSGTESADILTMGSQL